jgi:2,6-dihydroxypyridine 3-monooxygenase
VLVVGGSLGGLGAAVRLQAAGHQVTVLERSAAPLEDHGAGIVLHPETAATLEAHLGAPPSAYASSVRWLRYLTTDGTVAHCTPSRLRFASYAALYRRLREALPRFGGTERLGAEVVRVDQDATVAWAELRDGTRLEADLVVGADGLRSLVRRTLHPGLELRDAGYVAWRGVLPEESLSPSGRAPLAEAITYTILPGSHILTYPILDPAARTLRNWVWYRNVPLGPDRARLLTGRDGTRHQLSLPPGHARPEAIAQLRTDAAAVLPPPVAELVQRTPSPFLQVVVDLEPPALSAGRLCLLGDAGFVARPHAAAGTAKAAFEARVLASCLEGCDADTAPEALVRYDALARAAGQALVARSRTAGERAQRLGTWRVGEPLPFGLRRSGDSEDWDS